MSTLLAEPAAPVRPTPLARCYRFELVKLLSQWPVRLLLAASWTAPALFVAVVSRQSALPTDTVFGRWMHASGWAGSLVVLGFAGTWVLPLLTSLLAGDVFAAEDRLGTWRQLLVTVRSPRRLFAAKALASLTLLVLSVAGLAAAGIAGGLLAVGDRHHLVGLDGHLLTSAEAARTVLLAWVCALAPTLAFAGVGLLGSVALGRSPMGLIAPVVLAFLLQLTQLLPLPVPVRLALPSSAFVSWRGLFTAPAQPGPLLVGVAVSLAWALVATVLAHRMFLRRDFTGTAHDGSGRRLLASGAVPLAALLGLTVAVLAAASPATGAGIGAAKLESALATSFSHLYVLQTEELHRPAVTEAQLHAATHCDKGGDRVRDEGPGNDWRCVVTWTLPGATATGTAIYQLDVAADGRFVADGDGPKEVNGSFRVHTPTGDAPNPLWQIDGTVDLLTTPPKG